ncbi:hypothetical protein CRE_15746 [Caenorhabditis remanei]|uniref:Mos1 transposase HTH domain-containing protein n=1 Tax=Caenorhabditis remanei TaxID=31234 RepID=E3NHE2_CAERE|nr:hypothetical protein CRE_15746 [Caenorhabditis remanei]
MNAAPIFVPDRLHIRHVILFLFLSNSKITEIEERMVEVYKDNAPQRQTISRWVHRFKNNDFSLAEKARSGRPVELDIDKLREVVESDPFQSIRELATVMGSTHSAVERGLGALGKVKKMGRWIPHKLSNFDLERRVDMSRHLLTHHPNFNWLNHLVTSDEKWVLYENHHRRAQWVDADKQPEDVVKQELHPKKILLSVWWSVHGVHYWELLPEGKTITADYYSSQLQKVKSKLKTSPLHGHRVHYLHDNARPHTAKTTKSLLATFHWTVLAHPPYSPDLAPSDYHLFSDMHRSLEGQDFKTKSEVEKWLKKYFDSKQPEFWRKGIESLPTKWQTVVDKGGHYV